MGVSWIHMFKLQSQNKTRNNRMLQNNNTIYIIRLIIHLYKKLVQVPNKHMFILKQIKNQSV